MIEAKDLLNLENQNLFFKFLNLFRKGKVLEKSKLRLHYFIKNLEIGTENQKEKFMYYYNIIPGNYKARTYTEIAKEYNCSPSNIRSTVRQYLIWLKVKQPKEKMNEFKKIISTTKYKNGKNINLNRLK